MFKSQITKDEQRGGKGKNLKGLFQSASAAKKYGIIYFNFILYESKSNTETMEHGSNLIERIKTDFKSFEFLPDPLLFVTSVFSVFN